MKVFFISLILSNLCYCSDQLVPYVVVLLCQPDELKCPPTPQLLRSNQLFCESDKM